MGAGGVEGPDHPDDRQNFRVGTERATAPLAPQ